MPNNSLTREEIEDLDYYDFTAYVGVPYFHWGGMEATDRLATLSGIGAESRVLVVGCGTGFSACHLARSRGCQVVGLDIAPLMIAQAADRARTWEIPGQARFLVGDAHALPFEDGSFDAVLTEFVTVFLDKPQAMAEFVRVLAPGGHVGMNELFIKNDTPAAARQIIDEATAEFTRAVGMPLAISTPAEWQSLVEQAGLADTKLEQVTGSYDLGEYNESMGGVANMIKVVSKTLFYMSASQKLRRKLVPVGKLKDVLIHNKVTRDHVGAVLCVARKPA